MRVLQIGPVPPEVRGTTRGGVATNAWDLARGLAHRGHEVGILADNVPPSRAPHRVVDDVSILTMREGLPARLRALAAAQNRQAAYLVREHFGGRISLTEAMAGVAAYRRVMVEFDPDIVHVHHLENRFPFAYYGGKDAAPLVTTVHSSGAVELGEPVRIAENRALVQNNLRCATDLIFVSDFVRSRYQSIFPAEMSQLHTDVIHNAIDRAALRIIDRTEARAYIGMEETSPCVLFVGSLIATKRVDRLIDAAAMLKAQGFDHIVYVVGDGAWRRNLEERAETTGLSDTFRFEGSREHADLLYYYNAANVLALPSELEGFPMAVIEAMACGCPVVGTECAVAEAIGESNSGIVCESTPESLAAALGQIVAQPPDRGTVAGASARFDWEMALPRFEQVYERVSDGKC